MKGFSTKRFFDSEHLKKGMLMTATFKDGQAKSGLISHVTPDNLQFSYMDADTGGFKEETISIEQTENGSVVVHFATHLTDLQAANEAPNEPKRERPNPNDTYGTMGLKELLDKHLQKGTLESFLKKQSEANVDARVIAFILSRLSLPQNEFARLLFALPDALSLNVQKQMDILKELQPKILQSLEEQAVRLLRDFFQKPNAQKERPNPFEGFPFGGGGKNPLGDMFGDAFGDILGNLGKNNPNMNDNLQDTVSKLEDMIRNLFDNDNRRF